jgi:hypothetical protein
MGPVGVAGQTLQLEWNDKECKADVRGETINTRVDITDGPKVGRDKANR